MKTTTHLRKLKSGNYEICTEPEATLTFTSEEEIRGFFYGLSRERTTTWDRHYSTFKPARVIKARYSQAQTYFADADEFIAFINK